MASVVGTGALYVASWAAAAEAPKSEAPPTPAAREVEVPSSTRRLLTRLLAVLKGHTDGVSFVDLRSHLAAAKDDLRLAIDVGLRENQIRRTGSHNSLRYLSNSAH
jgi:hypothetical protein